MQAIISRNELSVMLNRVFEQLGDVNYDYSACADSILWLETHGFSAIDSLEVVFPQFLAKNHVPTKIVSSEPEHFTINAGGQSLFAIASVAVDLGASMLSRSNPFRITITHARNPMAMIPAIHRGRRYPGSIAAWWRSEDGLILNLVQGGTGYDYPEFQCYEVSDDDCSSQNIVDIVCCTGMQKISDLAPDTSTLIGLEALGQAGFAERHNQSLDAGIQVDTESLAKLRAFIDRAPT